MGNAEGREIDRLLSDVDKGERERRATRRRESYRGNFCVRCIAGTRGCVQRSKKTVIIVTALTVIIVVAVVVILII